MFKSVVREKRSDTACMRVSECLFLRRDPKFALNFCDIGNMSKYEIEFPSTHLVNCVKIVMASFGLPISRSFMESKASVSPFSVKSRSHESNKL
jgi:hypothetical protein